MKNRILFGGMILLLSVTVSCKKTDDAAVPVEPRESTTAQAPVALSGNEAFTVLVGGTDIGQLEVAHTSGSTRVEYEYRNNGRGPTISESVTFGEGGLPKSWTITGN